MKTYTNQQGKCRVSFYCESYQYRDSMIFEVSKEGGIMTEFESVKRTVLSILESDALYSTVKGTYWASFSFEEEVERYGGKKIEFEELFDERIRVHNN